MSKEGLQKAKDQVQRAQKAASRAQEARPLERTASPIVAPIDFAPRKEEMQPLAQMWNRLGEQKLAAKQIDKAIEMFERAVELDPKLDAARENLAAARRAQQRPGTKAASGDQAE